MLIVDSSKIIHTSTSIITRKKECGYFFFKTQTLYFRIISDNYLSSTKIRIHLVQWFMRWPCCSICMDCLLNSNSCQLVHKHCKRLTSSCSFHITPKHAPHCCCDLIFTEICRYSEIAPDLDQLYLNVEKLISGTLTTYVTDTFALKFIDPSRDIFNLSSKNVF